MRPVIYSTDALIFILIFVLSLWLFYFRKTHEWQLIQQKVSEKPRYLIAFMLLILYASVGVLDSLHFKSSSSAATKSILDLILSPLDREAEVTYSAPFALYSYSPEVIKLEDGSLKEAFPRLQFAGKHINNDHQKLQDILIRTTRGLGVGLLLTLACYLFWRYRLHPKHGLPSVLASKTFWWTLASLLCFITIVANLYSEYHILGTDKVGRDIFYSTVKSIRTGLVIGTVTTLVMLPFALFLGMWAGYLRGWVDDVIQYLYTTLSSIPGILLIAAAMLSFQVKIQDDPDLRLLILCVILGVTSWTTLCRYLRGESLKLRESDFVQSAVALGVTHLRIVWRHIMPNLMHIVIITVVLDFSGLVLAEAVLSYIGVGVDSVSFSWGNLINASRLDMAREPIVWWPLCGALFFMFTLVFSANIFSDALQEALNPRN